jgi:hypothetical protein
MALMLAIWAEPRLAMAESGPFTDLQGRWSGTGTIREEGQQTERIRCTADYRPRGSTGHEIDLGLRCNSDSYNFDLSGQFTADSSNQIAGNWTERSRGIGGTVVGNARGSRLQIHVESSAFAATVILTTRDRQQSVSIDSHGGGQVIKASITLRRN